MTQSYESLRSAAAALGAVVANVFAHLLENLHFFAASVAGGWFVFIVAVQAIGTIQLYRHYSSRPRPAVSPTLLEHEIPHVTILRPVKGLEPQLYECLASTFRLTYPRHKLSIYLCVSSPGDPSFPVLQRLVDQFSHSFDVRLFIEEQDPNLSGPAGEHSNLGPNPKIRNMSRGYREAKGDIVWIIDCNVWLGKGAAARMVDQLCGFRADGRRARPYKFVHQLPLVVDCGTVSTEEEGHGFLNQDHADTLQVTSTNNAAFGYRRFQPAASARQRGLRMGGGRFEEMFMALSHAKFYTAINTVAVAPCIVGKSNMFRKSHLDYLTTNSSSSSPAGIDFFSQNICEDHLVGDLLWRKKIPEEGKGEKWGKHQLVFGDLAIQPMAGMSVREYVGRRVRWLRVRKWTVTLATIIEPGVESFLCSAYGAFAFTTLPWFHDTFGIPRSWPTFFVAWFVFVLAWLFNDWMVYQNLHSGASIEIDDDTPSFARPTPNGRRRPAKEWLFAWLGRELLALPIWIWAVLGGTTVMWRGKKFWVGMDMKVHEITNSSDVSGSAPCYVKLGAAELLHPKMAEQKNGGPVSTLGRRNSRGNGKLD